VCNQNTINAIAAEGKSSAACLVINIRKAFFGPDCFASFIVARSGPFRPAAMASDARSDFVQADPASCFLKHAPDDRLRFFLPLSKIRGGGGAENEKRGHEAQILVALQQLRQRSSQLTQLWAVDFAAGLIE
jgi:hypothetical protein